MTVQLDIGGGQITESNMAAAQKRGASRIHLVVGDLNTHKAELDLIHKYGMEGVLDVEIPLWVNIGMNAGADISWTRPQLQACQQAGWRYFSEEGGGRSQIDVIRADGRRFINYGSENGANMYFGQYNHTADAHSENLIEWYHQYGISDGSYMATAKDSYAKCKVFGLTLMMYDTGDLYRPSVEPLKNSLDQLRNAGIPVGIVHMWSGQDVGAAFREPWVSVINFLESYYGGFANANTPTPTPEVLGGPIVEFSGQYTIDRDNGVDYIRGRARDKDGKPSTGRWTGLWKQDEKTGNWNGVAFVKVNSEAYFEYNLTKLLPKGYHVLRLQTDDGPLINMTPYQRW